MKKGLALLLILGLLISVLVMTGCGDGSSPDNMGVTLIEPADSSHLKLVASAKDVLAKLESEFLISTDTVNCGRKDLAKTIDKAVGKSKYVVIVGFEADDVVESASNYPDNKFIVVESSCSKVANYKNMLCVEYDNLEIAFLAGYIAGKSDNRGNITISSELSEQIFVALAQGIEYADSDIRINKAEASDGKHLFIDTAGRVETSGGKTLFSVTFDVGTCIYDIIKLDLEEGMWNGGSIWETDISSGYMYLKFPEENQPLSRSLKKDIERITAQIISGEIRMKSVDED